MSAESFDLTGARYLLVIVTVLAWVSGVTTYVWPGERPKGGAPVSGYNVVNMYPHDPRAFTQGLSFDRGVLVEGTGRRGHSTVRKVDLSTGKILQMRRLPDAFFGEGVTVLGDRIVQLTWQSQVGFVYDRETLAIQGIFKYSTEGWGLTYDGRWLIMSDGSSWLYFLDPGTFQVARRVEVRDEGAAVTRLNELEYVHGEIYANVWQTDRVARISAETGRVIAWVDLAGLLKAEHRTQPVDVLNGIAYDAEGERLFVTGKLWPLLFEITVRAAERP